VLIRRWSLPAAWYAWSLALVAAVVLAVPVGFVAASKAHLYRTMFAVALVAALATLVMRRPRMGAIVALVVFLPFMALIRRLLIASAGWSSYDPLLLVGALTVSVLLARLFLLERRPVAGDSLSKLIAALLAFTLVEVVNPLGGGITAGLGGLLFLAVPVLWFFAGRELITPRAATTLLVGVTIVSVVVACYGLWQGQVGFSSWDRNWVHVAGYAALSLGGGALRSFGTLSSSAEYASYLEIGLAVSLAMVAHRRWTFLLPIPVLLVALFLASTRGAIVGFVLVLIVLVALRQSTTRRALLALVLGIAVTIGVQTLLSGRLAATAAQTGNAAVSHQLGGLAHPLNSSQSTLLVHLQLIVNGVKAGVTTPIGHGTGSTNLAGAKFGSASAAASSPQNSELDISNAFVSFGVAGGVLYLIVVITALTHAVRAYRRRRSPLLLAATLVLVAGLGQWLTGGQYAVAPLMWTLVGWTSTEYLATMAAAGTRLRPRRLLAKQTESALGRH